MSLKKGTEISYICKNCGENVKRLWSYSRREQISRFLCRKCNTELTCLEKYGFKNVAQVPDIKLKFQTTNLERYGNICSLNGDEQIKKKIQTWINNFGKTNPYQQEQVKQKVKDNCLKEFGVEYVFQREDVKEKAYKGYISNYESMSHIHKYRYDNLNFDSWWEVCFYIKKRDEGCRIIREPCYFEYYIDDKPHRYYVDFIVDGVYYEVKSQYYIDQMPFEKSNCIKQNKVNIISDKDIQPYLVYIKKEYPNLKKVLRRSMKIGIFGGSFDPLTVAHMAVIREASKQYDKVYIVPTTCNYYRTEKRSLFTFDERVRIIEEIMCGEKGNVEIDTIERNQDSKWRSINTVEYFKKKFPNDDLFLIIGEDSYKNFPTWFRYDDILKLVNLVVVKRDSKSFGKTIPCEELKIGDGFIEVSSTKVRETLIKELTELYISDMNWYNIDYEENLF